MDYVRDWLPIRRGYAEVEVYGRADGGDHPGGGSGSGSGCCQAARVSEQTICTWRKRFGTFQADDVRRLKQLEHENARLKKLVAERDLEIEVMKEINAKNGERAGSPWPGGLRDGPRPVATAGLHAGPSRTVCPALSIAECGQERGGDRTDDGAFSAVSALRLPARAHLSGSRRLRDEPWPGASIVARGKAPGAAQTTTKAYCGLATTTTDAGRAEPGVGL